MSAQRPPSSNPDVPSTTGPYAQPADFSAGDMVGGYELVRFVHAGGFGQVWVGRHAILGDRCAVKVVPDGHVGQVELEGVRQYKRVADVHDGLVPIRELGAIPGRGFYYTMPLADDLAGPAVVRDASEYEAMTLHRYCEMHRPAPTDRVLAVAVQILPSLHALHEAGLVHRDIKPANVVRVEGTWKLCDPGLVARRDRITADCGTPGFIPPEGVRDRRADLYALGVTLYLLATDHPPRGLEDFRTGRLPAMEDGRTEALHGIIRRACEPTPSCRFQTALEMYQAVNTLVRTTRVTVVLDGDFSTFTQARLDEFLRAVRERGFHVFGVPACAAGSIRVTLEVAADQSEKLEAAVRAGAFSRFRVTGVEVPPDVLRHGADQPLSYRSTPAEGEYRETSWRDTGLPSFPKIRDPLEDVSSPVVDSPTPVPSPPPDWRFPGFEILTKLGQGGGGTVYEAKQVSLDRRVALKVMRELGTFDAWVEHRVRAHARIQHPNVLQVFEWGRGESGWFYTTELCTGGSLSNRLRAGPLPARESAAVVAAVADGVEAIHRAGIVHRDLKPRVVLFTEGGTPKVTSLEIAYLPGDTNEEIPGRVVGTPLYMAPEQARGEIETIGPAWDVFGLGAVLYECLTGRPPWEGDTPFDAIMQAVECQVTPPSLFNLRCPQDLQAICLKCMSREPSSRYPSAAEVAADLRRYLNGEDIKARLPNGFERAWRSVARNPSWAVAAALGALATLLALLHFRLL